MPNIKIYVDEPLYREIAPALQADLPGLRLYLCQALQVPQAACQLALIPVAGVPDQPQINAELAVLPHATRTPEKLRTIAQALRDRLSAFGADAVAVRISTLDAATYIALK